MGIFENAKEKSGIIKDNLKSFTTERINNKPKSKLVIDSIKEATNPVYNKYASVFKSLEYTITNKELEYFIKDTILEQTNSFYDVNIKTDTLKVMVQKLTSRVFEGASLKNEDEDINVINFTGNIAYSYLENDFTEIAKNIILYDKAIIKFNIDENGAFEMQILKPYQVKKFECGYDIVYFENGTTKIERRAIIENKLTIKYYETNEKNELKLTGEENHNIEHVLVYDLETNLEIVKTGVLELVLMKSQLYGLVDKEIVLGAMQMFLDNGYFAGNRYDYLRENIVVVDTPDNMIDINEQSKPLFEAVQPNLRSSDIESIDNLLDEQIATSMRLDRTTLGLQTPFNTATADKIANSETADTINHIKFHISNVINTFLQDFTGLDTLHFSLGVFRNNNPAELIDNNQKAVNGGIRSTKLAISNINKDLNSEELEKEYIRVLLENGKLFLKEDIELAQSLGMYENEEQTILEEETDGSIL